MLRWVVLAFIPSSLMLGVTMYLTTDIAAIPLLWVIPLALYLLTFILTFARRPILPHSWMVRALPMAAVVLALVLSISSVAQPISLPASSGGLLPGRDGLPWRARAASSCPGHLTAFYLAMSCGGVLGGLFNALIAPLVFDRVAEYPLALVLACLALPKTRTDSSERWSRSLDWVLPLCLGILTWGLVTVLQPRSGSSQDDLHAKLAFGLAGLVCYAFKDRPVRFALGLGAVLLVARDLHQQLWPGAVPASELLRSPARHVRRLGKLQPAYPWPHAPRPAVPRPGAAPRAADLLPPHRADRPGLRGLADARSRIGRCRCGAGSRIAGMLMPSPASA